MDCIFCKIIAGDIPCAKVYEDEKTFAFLDISPWRKGHTLVLPKTHVATLLDPFDACAVMKTIQKIGPAVAALGDGFNLVQNNGKAAGQLVMHVHFHLIPRVKNDGFALGGRSDEKYLAGEQEKVIKKMQRLIHD